VTASVFHGLGTGRQPSPRAAACLFNFGVNSNIELHTTLKFNRVYRNEILFNFTIGRDRTPARHE
jgi:hypothetical protein